MRALGRYARRVNPLLRDLLAPMQYYWVTAPSEYSTDVLFRRREDLEELMPQRVLRLRGGAFQIQTGT